MSNTISKKLFDLHVLLHAANYDMESDQVIEFLESQPDEFLAAAKALDTCIHRAETAVRKLNRLLIFFRDVLSIPVVVPDEPMRTRLRSIEDLEASLSRRIKSALRPLSYREREILKMFYGFGDGYTYTAEEIAKVFHLTDSRIYQIKRKALGNLKAKSWSILTGEAEKNVSL